MINEELEGGEKTVNWQSLIFLKSEHETKSLEEKLQAKEKRIDT